MPNTLVRGLAAGAAGTTALNAVTYLDVTLRGRPPSTVPDEAAGRMAGTLGVHLDENRRAGLGALLGYGTGLGLGVAYALVRRRLAHVPRPLAAAGLGLAAMAATDVPIVVSGLSDPRTWGAGGWAADVVPHLVYGWATAAALDAMR